MDAVPTPPPKLGPYLLICVAAATMVPLGTFQRAQQADSLIPILASLQHWTPFFWGQDRVGLLVPLLALPLHHPLLNLLVQDAICIFGLLAALLLLPRYLLGDASYPFVGLTGACGFLFLTPLPFLFDFSTNVFYGTWLALGLGGLVLLTENPCTSPSGRRMVLGLSLLVLAHWIYSGAALVLGPLVLLRGLLGRPHGTAAAGKTKRPLLLVAVAFALGMAFMHLASDVQPYLRTVRAHLPVSEWRGMWRRLVLNAWSAQAPYHWLYFLAGIMTIGILTQAIHSVRVHAARAWRLAAILVIVAALHVLFLGTQRWTLINECNYRYCHPAVFLIQGACLIVGLAPLAAALAEPWRRRLAFLAGLALLLAATRGDFPSLARARAAISNSMGACTDDILSARCTHVAGSYWQVWPAVYHANLTLHNRCQGRVVWGLSARSEPTRALWANVPMDHWRIAVLIDNGPDPDRLADAFHFPPSDHCEDYPRLPGRTERLLAHLRLPPLEVIEKRRTIWVLRPTCAGQKRSASPAGT